jgi:putative endonuclease
MRQGWHVLARNYRRHGFELDLIARKGETLAVVEVKARQRPPASSRFAEALLPARKTRALARGAATFIAEHAIEVATVRLDLAVVWPGGVAYHPGAIEIHDQEVR